MAPELQQQGQAGELTDAQLDQVTGGLVSELMAAVNTVAEAIGSTTTGAACRSNWTACLGLDPWS
jgi:hypothetical protein